MHVTCNLRLMALPYPVLFVLDSGSPAQSGLSGDNWPLTSMANTCGKEANKTSWETESNCNTKWDGFSFSPLISSWTWVLQQFSVFTFKQQSFIRHTGNENHCTSCALGKLSLWDFEGCLFGPTAGTKCSRQWPFELNRHQRHNTWPNTRRYRRGEKKLDSGVQYTGETQKTNTQKYPYSRAYSGNLRPHKVRYVW